MKLNRVTAPLDEPRHYGSTGMDGVKVCAAVILLTVHPTIQSYPSPSPN